MTAGDRVSVWRPKVPGVAEVLHAAWRDHAYPLHTHDTWTLLLVDDGVVEYELERQRHLTSHSGVTVLPPHVVHDGRPATSRGFRKRVVYLDGDVLGEALIGAAVDFPLIADDVLRDGLSRLDRALVTDERWEAESQLALVVERLRWHLGDRKPIEPGPPAAAVAQRARELFDADLGRVPGVTAAAESLGVSAAHLVRSFTRSFGIAPHRYLLGRRLDLARRRLLDGEGVAHVAAETGFYDQAHLTRHFSRLLAITPGRYQRSARQAA